MPVKLRSTDTSESEALFPDRGWPDGFFEPETLRQVGIAIARSVGLSVVPLGGRNIPVQRPGSGISTLVLENLGLATPTILGKIIREDTTPLQNDVSLQTPSRGQSSVTYKDYLLANPKGTSRWLTQRTWQELFGNKIKANLQNTKVDRATRQSTINVNTGQPLFLKTNTGESTMNLGDLLGTLGTELIKAKYGDTGSTTSLMPVTTGVDTGTALDPRFALDIPFLDDCKRKRRRRRKRLATASDIRDLAALKDTIGPSMTKTWIATHPS